MAIFLFIIPLSPPLAKGLFYIDRAYQVILTIKVRASGLYITNFKVVKPFTVFLYNLKFLEESKYQIKIALHIL